MSTRCQIVVKDSFGDAIIFYRHSDGYPEGAMPTLQKFMDWVRRGIIRDNAEQASGWLILIGAIEYQTLPFGRFPESDKTSWEQNNLEVSKAWNFDPKDWKCGAYEPANCRHGDIEFMYILNLAEKTITCYSTNFEGKGFPDPKKDTLEFVDTAKEPWKEEDTKDDED